MYMYVCVCVCVGECVCECVCYIHSGLVNEVYINVHVLMRDEKKGRKKQARSNKQQGKATQHTQGSHFS